MAFLEWLGAILCVTGTGLVVLAVLAMILAGTLHVDSLSRIECYRATGFVMLLGSFVALIGLGLSLIAEAL